MRIGFISVAKLEDRTSHSGGHYSMFRALRDDSTQVLQIGRSVLPLSSFLPYPLNRLAYRMGSRPIKDDCMEKGLWFARSFEQELERVNVDVLFWVNSPTAFLNTDIPVAYRSDLTFRLFVEHYKREAKSFSKEISDYLDECERRKIARANLLVYPSGWVAKSAVRDYGASPDKILVVPSGGNVENVPELNEILGFRDDSVCRLLFLGKDWERKGGNIAVETALALNQMGVKTKLFVVGATPSPTFPDDVVEIVGFLSKDKHQHRRKLHRLMMECHFMHVPTRAEAFGFVFCEACAYAMPVISTSVGGVPSIVQNGLNGYLLPTEARGDEYAEVIQKIFVDRDEYVRMACQARQLFDDRLNWTSWGHTVRNALRDLCSKKR